MNTLPYVIRNYLPADFAGYLRLNIEAEKLEATGRTVTPQLIAERLNRPNYSPERDLFLVEIAENIVGYTEVTPELGIGRVLLNCWLHPAHRGRGLAARLLGSATIRAQELGARVAHVNILQDNAVAARALTKLGFRLVRRYLELRLDMAEVRWQDTRQAAVACRHLRQSEEDKLAQIQNRSFAGTWGFNPNTAEEISYRLNLSNCSAEDVVFACDGDKVAGYCWTGIAPEADTSAGARKGKILMIGVDPDCRGQGFGKRVLLAALGYLNEKGLKVVELSVDSENRDALTLYYATGFKVRTNSLWYEKTIS